ncbi:hypothetical protein ACFE04_016237 [Oxalis oulophora]
MFCSTSSWLLSHVEFGEVNGGGGGGGGSGSGSSSLMGNSNHVLDLVDCSRTDDDNDNDIISVNPFEAEFDDDDQMEQDCSEKDHHIVILPLADEPYNEHDKIRELSQQLAIEKKRAASYKRHLELLFEEIEKHNESLAKKIEHIVDNVPDKLIYRLVWCWWHSLGSCERCFVGEIVLDQSMQMTFILLVIDINPNDYYITNNSCVAGYFCSIESTGVCVDALHCIP